jgi:hypothetical protein
MKFGQEALREFFLQTAVDEEQLRLMQSAVMQSAQRPSVQVETMRTRLRKSSSRGISWDRYIFATQLAPNCRSFSLRLQRLSPASTVFANSIQAASFCIGPRG